MEKSNIVKSRDLKVLSNVALYDKILGLKRNLLALRFQIASGESVNTKLAFQIRKSIARLYTEYSSRKAL